MASAYPLLTPEQQAELEQFVLRSTQAAELPPAEAAPAGPIAFGSGQSQATSAQNQDRSSSRSQIALMVDPDDATAAMDLVRGLPEYQALDRSLGDRELVLEAMRQTRPQLDVSPMLSLIDTWTGSKLAPAYQRPENQIQAQERVLRHLDEQRAAEQGLANYVLQGLSAQKGGGYQLDESAVSRLTSDKKTAVDPKTTVKVPVTRPGQVNQFEKEVTTDIRKQQTEFDKSSQSMVALREALQSGQLNRIKSALVTLSRAMGERGASTEGDVNRILPRTLGTTLDNIENWATGLATLSPRALESLRATYNALDKALRMRTQQSAANLRKVYEQRSEYRGSNAGKLIQAWETRLKSLTSQGRPKMKSMEEFQKLSPDAKEKYLREVRKNLGAAR